MGIDKNKNEKTTDWQRVSSSLGSRIKCRLGRQMAMVLLLLFLFLGLYQVYSGIELLGRKIISVEVSRSLAHTRDSLRVKYSIRVKK